MLRNVVFSSGRDGCCSIEFWSIVFKEKIQTASMDKMLRATTLIIWIMEGRVLERAKILLVEDNRDEEDLAMYAFKKAGVDPDDIVVVRDGEEAVHYLCAKGQYEGQPFDPAIRVVFLDLNLPKIHGLDVLKQLRANSKTQCLPVVILSSSDEESDISEGYRAGANSYIQKSFDFSEFKANISAMRIYWLDMNLSPFSRL